MWFDLVCWVGLGWNSGMNSGWDCAWDCARAIFPLLPLPSHQLEPPATTHHTTSHTTTPREHFPSPHVPIAKYGVSWILRHGCRCATPRCFTVLLRLLRSRSLAASGCRLAPPRSAVGRRPLLCAAPSIVRHVIEGAEKAMERIRGELVLP